MARTKKPNKVRTYTGKPKSIGSKFAAILLICALTIVSLIGSALTTKSIHDEMKTSFDYELKTAVETIVSSIDTYHDFDPAPTAKTLALKIVQDAKWNNGRRTFWATSQDDSAQVLAGTIDHDSYYETYSLDTKFGFKVHAGYDKTYFEQSAYPKTEETIRISIATTLTLAIFALGACAIAFYRSAQY